MQFKSEVTRTLTGVLFVPSLLMPLAVAAFYVFLSQTEADTLRVGVAGRQRLIAQQVLGRAERYQAIGGEALREELRAAVVAFDAHLHALRHGGAVADGTLPPLPPEASAALAPLEQLWPEQRQTALAVVSAAPGDVRAQALRELQSGTPALIAAAEELVRALDARSRELRQYMLFTLGLLAALGVAAAALALVLVRALQRTRTHTATALAEGEALHALVLRTSRDGFFSVGRDTRFREVNDAYCRMLGYTRAELLAMRVADVEAAETPAEIEAHAAQVLAQGHDRFETRHRRKDGTVLEVELSVTAAEVGGEQVFFSFARDVAPRKQAERERLAQLEHQREALVREVHHRIKNNLQGVIGLLRRQADAHPPLRAALEGAMAQVSTMAAVHGLQGKHASEELRLCDLCQSIAAAVAALTGVAVEPLVQRQAARPVRLAASKGVPLALILNELIFNAVKHGDPWAGGPVLVLIDLDDRAAWVRITNSSQGLPPGLDFAAGQGLGTGLALVQALLPPRHAHLSLRSEGGSVVAELRLEPPVVQLLSAP